MNTNKLQKLINDIYQDNFGYTPLSERMGDIQKQFFDLTRWSDINDLKDSTSDLLSSLIQLCNENNWDIGELIKENLTKIKSRELQYKSLGRKYKVAILGGAFNPITSSHIQTAQFVLNSTGEFDEVWLMPSYKHMYNKKLQPPEDRLNMCKLATKVDGRIKVFDYEIKNELSGETFNTIKRIKQDTELNNKYDFSLIIGMDNANTFNRWVNHKELEKLIQFVVVDRQGTVRDKNVDWYINHPHIYLKDEGSIMENSSTLVRDTLHGYYHSIEENKEFYYEKLKGLLNENILDYILKNKLYQ